MREDEKVQKNIIMFDFVFSACSIQSRVAGVPYKSAAADV